MPDSVLEGLLKACQSGQFDLAHKEVRDIIAEGHPVSQILSQVSSKVFSLNLVEFVFVNYPDHFKSTKDQLVASSPHTMNSVCSFVGFPTFSELFLDAITKTDTSAFMHCSAAIRFCCTIPKHQ